MGTFPLSLVPQNPLGVQAYCAWAPEPVFALDEAARLLGVTKITLVKTVRRRFPEVKLEAKVVVSLTTTFGPTFTNYGEVRLKLDSPGGPQEHVCLTHYGLFRHAVYIRTPEARNFVLRYPEFVLTLASGKLRPPASIAPMWQAILQAPRGRRTSLLQVLGQQLGVPMTTMWSHLSKIKSGCVTADGLPARRKNRRFLYPDRVRFLRESLGDSQEAFARRVGTTKYAVRDWEAGKWGMRRSSIQKITAACPGDLARGLLR